MSLNLTSNPVVIAKFTGWKWSKPGNIEYYNQWVSWKCMVPPSCHSHIPIEVNQNQFRNGYSFCGYTKFTEQTCPSTFNRTKHLQKWNQIWYQCQVCHSLLLRNKNSCYKCRCMVQDMSMTLCLVLRAIVSNLLKTSFVITCSNS